MIASGVLSTSWDGCTGVDVVDASGLEEAVLVPLHADGARGAFDAMALWEQRGIKPEGDDVLTGQPGYDGNHGSGVSRQAWTQKGLDSTSVGSCNTFSAPANQVR